MDDKKLKKHKIYKVIVNIITGMRTIGTAAMLPIFINFGYLGAGISAILLFLTDFIDGYLARKLKVQSFFGSLLDGLSDKALGIICLLILSFSNPLFLTVILSELLILIINYKSIQRGNNAKSSIAGKIKTGLMGISIVSSFFVYGLPNIKDLVHYINIDAINKLANINPDIITSFIVGGLLCADAYVITDYSMRAIKQDKKRNNDIKELENNIEKIENEKQELQKEKQKILELKSKEEILHALFDTDFYLEHKDDGIKRLLYK